MEGSAVPSLCSEYENLAQDQCNLSHQLLLNSIPRPVYKLSTDFPPVLGLFLPSGTREPCRDEFHNRKQINKE